MPTTNYRARKMLRNGRARIFKYRPLFTIQLDREGGKTQPIEYKCDTGYAHIGVSVCSKTHKFVNAQYDLLTNEPERHDDRRKLRRSRRNRLRYRKPRFNNRRGMIAKEGFAPSIRTRRDCHILLITKYVKILPVTKAVFEMGQFDTQVLKAMEAGKPLPQGKDYQHGERYGTATLREAVFARDNYTCIFCGRSAFRQKAILHVHHIGFWKGDHTNRLANLGTACEICHIPRNHKPGGKLYGAEPKLPPLKGATFMTMVRWDMLSRIKEKLPGMEVSITYGAATKEARHILNLKKSHSNDAYCMGMFHPSHRADFKQYEKRRRNNRILEKFYDAKYLDIRDGRKKPGAGLSCGRINRREPRDSAKNERIYRGTKLSAGKRSIRRMRYPCRPGDTVVYQGHKRVVLENGKSVDIKEDFMTSVTK